MAGENYIDYVTKNPDLMAEYNRISEKGKSPYNTLDSFGAYHWNTFGQNEGRGVTPYAQATNPTISPTTASTGANTSIQDATNRARSNIENEFRFSGVDPGQYQSDIQSYLDSILSTIPANDSDPYGYFNGEAGKRIIGGIESRNRNQFVDQARGIGQGFALNFDQELDKLISDKASEATTQFDRAKTRGQLNQVGYDRALKGIGAGKEKALSGMKGYLGDINNQYSATLDSLRNDAIADSSDWRIGENFNLDKYKSSADSIINGAKNSAWGTLSSLFDSGNYFDIGDLMNQAGSAQGAQNMRNTDVMAAVERKKSRDSQRGLGSTGAF